MNARTPFIETEALVIALEDGESDRLHDYVVENLLPNEAAKLAMACRALSWTLSDAKGEIDGRAAVLSKGDTE